MDHVQMYRLAVTDIDQLTRSTYRNITTSNTDFCCRSFPVGRGYARSARGEANAMLNIDWRSSAPYSHTKHIPAGGFAWEYLRRFDEYHQDYLTISRIGKPIPHSLEAFSRRWGLRFPVRPRNTAQQPIPVLDSEPSATGHPPGGRRSQGWRDRTHRHARSSR